MMVLSARLEVNTPPHFYPPLFVPFLAYSRGGSAPSLLILLRTVDVAQRQRVNAALPLQVEPGYVSAPSSTRSFSLPPRGLSLT